MKVCDHCRKPMTKGTPCLGAELCEECANHVREWIKKPAKQGNIFEGMFGGNKQ